MEQPGKANVCSDGYVTLTVMGNEPKLNERTISFYSDNKPSTSEFLKDHRSKLREPECFLRSPKNSLVNVLNLNSTKNHAITK